jgi:transcriptional antiterminator NusG
MADDILNPDASPTPHAPPDVPAAGEHTPETPKEPPAHQPETAEGATPSPPEASPPDGEQPPAEQAAPAPPPSNKHWYVVKVQSGREESIKEAIEKRVKIEGLEEYFGQIVIPTKSVTEMRNGKRVTKEQKLFPGYLMAEVEFNDRILYLFRETSGVGDFVGGTINRPPPPLSEREVNRMIGVKHEVPTEVPTKPKFDKGDKVKVTVGTFSGMEGEVKEIIESLGKVRVELTIFGRPVSVEHEYWQVEPV